MTILETIEILSKKGVLLCPCLQKAIFTKSNEHRTLKNILGFCTGFIAGQMYYVYLLKICFPNQYIGLGFSLFLNIILGICTVISIQIRCILLLCVPMYCGKPGRGILKAMILTYIVAGPITNMGLNAKEIVRVFTCSNELSYNISLHKYTVLVNAVKSTALDLNIEVDRIKDNFRYFKAISRPLEKELENKRDGDVEQYDYLDYMYELTPKADGLLENQLEIDLPNGQILKNYTKTLLLRCDNMFKRANQVCNEIFTIAYKECLKSISLRSNSLCWRLEPKIICNFESIRKTACVSPVPVDTGLDIGYKTLKIIKFELTKKIRTIKYKFEPGCGGQYIENIQDARTTNDLITKAFEDKSSMMHFVVVVLNICMALLFLRILLAAVTYHDMYLMNISHDNVYITGYFKRLDERRRISKKMYLLPLKKMERLKYINVHSLAYMSERSKLATQILKLTLEMITATTFVMMDRMFYEALVVVKRYADVKPSSDFKDLEIEIDGVGPISTILRRFVENLNLSSASFPTITNKECIPRPRSVSPEYFFKIYGGYLWILLLLYLNPYTLRLRRLICAYFYPRREKQRILHLYNDILKKRMKMDKTLRRKAVQAVRTHYLSSENLLSMRMRFPELLGWLYVLPAARMTCLICGETEPRREILGEAAWFSCPSIRCPFIYCAECWLEAGQACLACDPTLAELSDINSITDDEKIK